jgi:hypothetical protein
MKSGDKIRFKVDIADPSSRLRKAVYYALKGDKGKVIEVRPFNKELIVSSKKHKRFLVYTREVEVKNEVD